MHFEHAPLGCHTEGMDPGGMPPSRCPPEGPLEWRCSVRRQYRAGCPACVAAANCACQLGTRAVVSADWSGSRYRNIPTRPATGRLLRCHLRKRLTRLHLRAGWFGPGGSVDLLGIKGLGVLIPSAETEDGGRELRKRGRGHALARVARPPSWASRDPERTKLSPRGSSVLVCWARGDLGAGLGAAGSPGCRSLLLGC